MIAIISLLVVVSVSILITRVATIALTHTGLSRESARFQARSAFTGAGFTTQESEGVVGHPVRRRIVMLLMLLGNAGIVTAVSSLMLTFVGQDSGSTVLKAVALASGLALLWSVSSSAWVDRHLSRLIDRALKRYTRLDVRDYASLMHLAGDYRLAELAVEGSDWACGKSLAEARLRQEGIIVLGIKRADESYVGAPTGETLITEGDVLVLYGRTEGLCELDERPRGFLGDREHAEAMEAHAESREDEADADPVARQTAEVSSGSGSSV